MAVPATSLSLAGVVLQARPKLTADESKAMFEQLATEFGFDPAIATYLAVTVQCQSLTDFRALFTAPGEVGTFVDAIPNLTNARRDAARLRQAWEACFQAEDAAILQKKRGSESTDLDELLDSTTLQDQRELFYARYKVKYPAWIEPSDFLVSRIYKELSKRLLQVHSVWKTKSLGYQMKAERKRQRLTDKVDLVTTEQLADDDEDSGRSLPKYMSLLWTLLIAYVRAGTTALSTAPSTKETLGTPSEEYVEVPLDAMIMYYAKMQKSILNNPHLCTLDWIQSRDEAERQVWIEEHRSSTKTLGTIIVQVMARRESMWEAPVEQRSLTRRPSDPGSASAAHAGPASQSTAKHDLNAGIPVGGRCTHMRDGSEICQKWQNGQCPDPCPNNRKHVCCAKMKGRPSLCVFQSQVSQVQAQKALMGPRL